MTEALIMLKVGANILHFSKPNGSTSRP